MNSFHSMLELSSPLKTDDVFVSIACCSLQNVQDNSKSMGVLVFCLKKGIKKNAAVMWHEGRKEIQNVLQAFCLLGANPGTG